MKKIFFYCIIVVAFTWSASSLLFSDPTDDSLLPIQDLPLQSRVTDPFPALEKKIPEERTIKPIDRIPRERVTPSAALKNKYIADSLIKDPNTRNDLMIVYGPRSPRSMFPDRWYYVYFDDQSAQNGRTVTTYRGKPIESKEGILRKIDFFRLFAYKPTEVLRPESLVVDSDEAFQIIREKTQGRLDTVRLSTVTYLLTYDKNIRRPVWEIKFYADRLGEEVGFGKCQVAANDGEIIRMDFNFDKLSK